MTEIFLSLLLLVTAYFGMDALFSTYQYKNSKGILHAFFNILKADKRK